MEFTVQQIAQILGGKIEGDANRAINNLAKIQEASSNSISFLSNPKYESFLYTTKAAAVIVDNTFQLKEKVETTLIWVNNSYSAFSALLEEYHKLTVFSKAGVEQPSFISEGSVTGKNIYRGAFSYIGKNCKIGDNVKIYPNTFIGDDVTIGSNTVIYAGVKIYAGTLVGNYCTFQSGSVIGSDGFGFAPQPDGTFKTIPQIGNVIIEDHVDIGANTVIDCATMGSTVIRKGVKLDNLVQIAHNVEIGKNTVMAAQTGVAGSTVIGENCIFAGQVGIVGHINVANHTTMAAKAGLSKTIKEEGKTLAGYPGMEHKQYLKTQVIFRKLPEVLARIEELEQKMINLISVEQEAS